jgi:hypothetical protein
MAGCGFSHRYLAGDEHEELRRRLRSGATLHCVILVMLKVSWAGRVAAGIAGKLRGRNWLRPLAQAATWNFPASPSN